MQTRIQGTVMPVLEVRLDPNESIFAESGELSWMTSSIQMSTHTQMGGGGGLFGALKRVVGGGTLFMTEYNATPRTPRAKWRSMRRRKSLRGPGHQRFIGPVLPGRNSPPKPFHRAADGTERSRATALWANAKSKTRLARPH